MREFTKFFTRLHGTVEKGMDFWIQKKCIPLGTKKPFDWYASEEDMLITDEQGKFLEIRTIPINDAFEISTKLNPNNILILGYAGDMKSYLMKLLWWFFSLAGFYNLYFDAKSTDAGSAKIAHRSDRLPPYTKPEGIALDHYVPVWVAQSMPEIEHNFFKYAIPIENIKDREMWLAVGMGENAANGMVAIREIFKENGKKPTHLNCVRYIQNAPKQLIQERTGEAMIRVLNNLKAGNVINAHKPTLNLQRSWQRGKSVVVSYDGITLDRIGFEIGMITNQCLDYNRSVPLEERRGIVIYYDDASIYADKEEGMYANKRIASVGMTGRTKGVNGVLTVHSLKSLTATVAESFNIKIITPSFPNPDGLKDINIPKNVITKLKQGKAVYDKGRHNIEMCIVRDGKAEWFFPFWPGCGHFQNVLTIREEVVR